MPAAGYQKSGDPLQETFSVATVVEPQVTVGAVTAVPAITVAGDGLPQVNLGLIFMVPQSASSLQSPVAGAFAFML